VADERIKQPNISGHKQPSITSPAIPSIRENILTNMLAINNAKILFGNNTNTVIFETLCRIYSGVVGAFLKTNI